MNLKKKWQNHWTLMRNRATGLRIQTLLFSSLVFKMMTKYNLSLPVSAVLRIRDPGSGAFVTPGSTVGPGTVFSVHGSRIPTPYFWEVIHNFLGKKYDKKFFLYPFKTKIIFSLWYLWQQNKVGNIFPSPLLLLLMDLGSGIRDPWSRIDKNQDPEQTSRIHNTVYMLYYLPGTLDT